MDYDKDTTSSVETLEGYVMNKVDRWRDHFDSNYQEKFDEYNRLWRGIWSSEDKTRESERSKLISPAIQQAVESAVAEVEEATFGRGKWFDIKDDLGDPDNKDIGYLREKLTEDFAFTKTRKAVAECILTSAVYGTGIGELVLDEIKEMTPATQPIMDGALKAVGVNIKDRVVVKLRPILPQNFLIDPVASSIEEACGVAIDEFVPEHQVKQNVASGVYYDVDLGTAATDTDLEPDKELAIFPEDKIRLTKYYGLVPRYLLEKAILKAEASDDDEVDVSDLVEKDEEDSSSDEYVEAIVVLANGGVLLKAQENPYMMQDRPVIAFSWDVVPSRFWGRGICEKGYNSQKALDAELRARIDALALTVHPMMAMDATRMPRGSKLEIRPGKTILTNGNPAEILQPFRFGNLDQVTFTQAAELQKMVQMATGAVDAAGIPGSINGEAAAGAVSMSLGAIIKRHKRTLINFQESFLIPLVEKAAWRYMQYNPEQYPVSDYKFVPSSSLGVIAREYEVTQLVQLLQTLGQDSPLYPMLVQAVVENMSLSNREELIEQIKALAQPDPMAQQQQQQALAIQQAEAEAKLRVLAAQAAKYEAEAQKVMVEAQLEPQVVQAKMAAALATNLEAGQGDDKEFERRAKIAELMIKEKDIDSNERIARMQVQGRNVQ
jgi:flagellar biosynthesis regulator FlaF